MIGSFQNGVGLMRILIIDDEESLHDAYREVFRTADSKLKFEIRSMEEDLFGEQKQEVSENEIIELSFASQGLQGIEKVRDSIKKGNHFQVAFIDFRMPPGIDGKETARLIRTLDPNINIVIVSAFADNEMSEIAKVAGPAHKVFFIAKPFNAKEISQMAYSLCQRWEYDSRQLLALHSKILELAESEARAIKIANHDMLTGAPNRMFFLRELNNRIEEQAGNIILALLDIDKFKEINDNFGHFTGDDLINNLYHCIRNNCPKETFIARLGGDEFAMLFNNIDGAEAHRICENLISKCSRPFNILHHTVQTSASVGLLVCSTECERDAIAKMRMADTALHQAKSRGRNQVCVYDKQLDEVVRFKKMVLNTLEQAMKEGELAVHFQPIVERNGLSIVGFEALLRWNSKQYGAISPGIFIPIVEDSELIYSVSEWVISEAIKEAANWPSQYVSINFSPKQFKREGIVEYLCQCANEVKLDRSRVQIEITETAIFEDIDRAKAILRQLRELGFKIALDDFGTGYSSMVSVKNFDLDCIKIDKSFVDQVGREKHSDAIVNSINFLARSLGLNVVAEGVEDEAQCQALRLLGCSHLQGYLFGAALKAEDALNFAINGIENMPSPMPVLQLAAQA